MGMIVVMVVLLAMVGGANYYLAKRIYQCFQVVFPKISSKVYMISSVVATLIMAVGFARSMLPIQKTVKTLLGEISAYWMGVFVYLLLFFVVADVLLIIGKWIKLVPSPMPQGVRLCSGVLVMIGALATVTVGFVNANKIQHVSYEVQLSETMQTDGMKIVMISDLHLGSVRSEARLLQIVEEINLQKPDVVCMAGDIFDSDYQAINHPKKAIETLLKIEATHGVYACLGNHDAGETIDDMIEFLEKCEIKLLDDTYDIIDNQYILVGRLDGRPIGGQSEKSRQEWEVLKQELDKELPIIVLDHNPAHIEEYGKDVDIILSGHTHKGQLFPINFITQMMYVVDYGHYQKDAESPHVIVSSGVGFWGMPMRVGSKSEIVSVLINK